MTSSDSSKATPWLTPGLVENILRKCEHDDSIRVVSISSKSATVGGDNYMSDISRINIAFTRGQAANDEPEKKTLIFKVSLNKNTAAHDVSREAEVFETEIEMMQNTLVKMNEILDEKDSRLNARVFHAQIGDPSFLVLEDLGTRGFRLADRQLGLDRDHSILVMRNLARFHASSVALYEKDPSCITNYRRGLYHENCPQPIQYYVKEVFKELSSDVKKWPGLDSSYSEKLLKLADVCFEKTVKCAAFKEQEFNVINHGDAWINNMMFRYDEEGKVVDHIFLDFQICFWSSPAYDVIYVLYSNANDDVYAHHFEELVAEYLETLSSTMARIKCKTKPPSLDSIRRAMREREFLGVLTSIVAIPFQLIDTSEVMNFSELVQSELETRSPGMKNERFRRIMTRRLKEWNSRGLLDI